MSEMGSGLTWDEWVEMGVALKRVRSLLFKIGTESKARAKAMKGLDTTCCELDSLVFEAFRGRKDLKRECVFYGQQHPNEG